MNTDPITARVEPAKPLPACFHAWSYNEQKQQMECFACGKIVTRLEMSGGSLIPGDEPPTQEKQK